MKVCYICDGLRFGCDRTICSYLGRGECKHTISEAYALYGKADQITEDRFVITDDMAIEIDRDEVMKNEEVLDKIRSEIKQEYNRLRATREDETLELGECLGLKMSLKIIDKYKAEGE